MGGADHDRLLKLAAKMSHAIETLRVTEKVERMKILLAATALTVGMSGCAPAQNDPNQTTQQYYPDRTRQTLAACLPNTTDWIPPFIDAVMSQRRMQQCFQQMDAQAAERQAAGSY